MMAKKLKYSRIDLVDRVGALMLVTFLDDNGDMYQWAPKWKEVEQVFLKQINVERFNKPESEWLNKFAKTAQSVVEGAQRITSARKLGGRFSEYQNGKLNIDKYNNAEPEYLTPGFHVSIKFLEEWLGENVDAFVIDDMVIRLSRFVSNEDNEYATLVNYPPSDNGN